MSLSVVLGRAQVYLQAQHNPTLHGAGLWARVRAAELGLMLSFCPPEFQSVHILPVSTQLLVASAMISISPCLVLLPLIPATAKALPLPVTPNLTPSSLPAIQ
jgi:hypothetical protein